MIDHNKSQKEWSTVFANYIDIATNTELTPSLKNYKNAMPS